MYPANLQQIYSNNPNGKPFKSWIVYAPLESTTTKESYLKEKHKTIDTTLSEQNVNYSEITTVSGKQFFWDKFDIKNKNHPVFLISNKYPDNCTKKDKVLIIDWGDYKNDDDFRSDVMKLVYMFNKKDFINLIIDAYDKKNWDKVINYIKKNGISLVGIGVSIISAVI